MEAEPRLFVAGLEKVNDDDRDAPRREPLPYGGEEIALRGGKDQVLGDCGAEQDGASGRSRRATVAKSTPLISGMS